MRIIKEKKKGLLDTGVFLKYFLGEEGKEEVGELLDKSITKEIEGFVSVVTISELVTICIRNKKEFLIPTLLEFIHQNFAVLDTTFDIGVLSGYFKAKYSKGKRTLSHADSVILACAFVYSCTLITYDPEFEGVNEIEILDPDEYLDKLEE
jgi:predicted nucleic acid-binding protein